KTVEDSAALHQAICGHDPHDLTSYVHKNASYFTNLSDCNNLNGITIGVDETQFNQNIQPEVKLNIMNV
ncbi:MAG TPA: Asp-tRNA(Asn)/Glu-tRNA(Gln) amidotransferase GatCAB subunit A, partial [Chloroflexi bacterium]|nr:Asp-tRNA(Asn)/Glu-tRNA(Gln) amidotransferase GatCAB subunit A [Chloroflexota bacterium]